MSHGVFQSPQCIPFSPTAAGEILTDKDRIGKYLVQDSKKVEREEQLRGGMSTQEGKKKTPKG